MSKKLELKRFVNMDGGDLDHIKEGDVDAYKWYQSLGIDNIEKHFEFIIKLDYGKHLLLTVTTRTDNENIKELHEVLMEEIKCISGSNNCLSHIEIEYTGSEGDLQLLGFNRLTETDREKEQQKVLSHYNSMARFGLF